MRGEGRIVYLDNAATSWPKPDGVGQAITAYLRDAGGNPGRSGHRLSLAAGRVVAEAREAAARILGCSDPLSVIFAANATAAINIALSGFLRAGDRVVADSMVHNATARPLTELSRTGVKVSWAAADRTGHLDLDDLERRIRGAAADRPARMVVLTHGSNVSGSLAPLRQVARLCGQYGTVLLVDAAQTAGIEDIALDTLGAAVVAFTGHKAMLGPGGTGGLAFGPGIEISDFRPIMRGGTGSHSDSEDHPGFMPDRFEAGTVNGAGLAGLLAGLRWIEATGMERIRQAELDAIGRLRAGLLAIPGVTVYGPAADEPRCAVLSFTLAGWSVSDLATELDDRYGILCRVGLHCAPRAHRSLGTFPDGTVRWAPGPFTLAEDVEYACQAVEELAREKCGASRGNP